MMTVLVLKWHTYVVIKDMCHIYWHEMIPNIQSNHCRLQHTITDKCIRKVNIKPCDYRNTLKKLYTKTDVSGW